ncbi:NAD(P)/FAD-dependent oxidoreductase [Dongia sp.]|uniref:NAD(P)/FAD-dependent oxidoreductase n=1 Tax=Dongia sp. TaxID=1977262 RepID=UPI0037538D6C
MVGPRVDPLLHAGALPKDCDVVVIGGGIIGASTALTLAERGVSVALCEKGQVGAEQSSRNWGWCRKMGRDPAEIPLAIESLRLWERINARTGAETGFRQTGILYLCDRARDVEKHEAWLAAARDFQVDSRVIASREIDHLLPGSARRWAGALYTPSDGVAEPEQATTAIANAALRQGAAIIERCAVRGIETEAGAISGVVTERGRVRCSRVVLAGGAWSSLFCGNLGIRFPQLKILGSVMRTAPFTGPGPAVGADRFAFRKRADGGYTLAQRNANLAHIVPDSFRFFADFLPSLVKQWHELRLRVGRRFIEEWQVPRRWQLDGETPFEQVRVLDPQPSRQVLRQGFRNLTRAFPQFAAAKVIDSWAGLIDVTPDAVPVISAVDSLPGFYIASGFSGHGFGIGPAAGHLMADLVMGETPIVDPRPYRFERLGSTAGSARNVV